MADINVVISYRRALFDLEKSSLFFLLMTFSSQILWANNLLNYLQNFAFSLMLYSWIMWQVEFFILKLYAWKFLTCPIIWLLNYFDIERNIYCDLHHFVYPLTFRQSSWRDLGLRNYELYSGSCKQNVLTCLRNTELLITWKDFLFWENLAAFLISFFVENMFSILYILIKVQLPSSLLRPFTLKIHNFILSSFQKQMYIFLKDIQTKQTEKSKVFRNTYTHRQIHMHTHIHTITQTIKT